MLVDEQVDVAAHLARLVADAAVESRVAPLELLEGGTHARGRQGELRGAPAAGAQRRWKLDRDCHGAGFRKPRLHRVLPISRSLQYTEINPEWTRSSRGECSTSTPSRTPTWRL